MMYIAPAFTDQFHGFKRAEFKFAVIPILSLILYKQPSCIFITKEVADSEKEAISTFWIGIENPAPAKGTSFSESLDFSKIEFRGI